VPKDVSTLNIFITWETLIFSCGIVKTCIFDSDFHQAEEIAQGAKCSSRKTESKMQVLTIPQLKIKVSQVIKMLRVETSLGTL
jgi:hypothetical protein